MCIRGETKGVHKNSDRGTLKPALVPQARVLGRGLACRPCECELVCDVRLLTLARRAFLTKHASFLPWLSLQRVQVRERVELLEEKKLVSCARCWMVAVAAMHGTQDPIIEASKRNKGSFGRAFGQLPMFRLLHLRFLCKEKPTGIGCWVGEVAKGSLRDVAQGTSS